MDTEMFDKIQALSFGFTIWKPGVRYGIEDPVVAVRISFLYHLVERERWIQISSMNTKQTKDGHESWAGPAWAWGAACG
jgi:hypothetical protein